MPRKPKKERVAGQYFVWLLGPRANGVYYADGRSNQVHAGRHSLGTRDRQEALRQLARLDLVQAVERGLVDRALLKVDPADLLSLEEGRRLYLDHVRRPLILGGAERGTQKRYRAVLDKFLAFCKEDGVLHWQAVTKKVVQAYGAWLDDEGYAYATEYLELTTIKQMMKWLAEEKHIPAACLFALPLEKPQGTTTYCYQPEEVEAILGFCSSRSDLKWLGEVVLALTTTGLRIGELAQLRWSDFDLGARMLRLTDTRRRGGKAERDQARSTKSHRDRVLPIHADLLSALARMDRHPDGRVFHGPLGGQLKPDTVRNVMVREVLEPLAEKFPTPPGERKGFRNGRLHSFRHYFCSVCANSGTPEQVVMKWLGHRDSKMVKHYYHLHDAEAQRQMAKIRFRPQSAPQEVAGSEPA